MAKLENWSIGVSRSNPFTPPEMKAKFLMGNVYGHDDFEDGTQIGTSTIKSLDIKNRIAKTKNTTYNLGKPSQAYLEYLKSIGRALEDYEV